MPSAPLRPRAGHVPHGSALNNPGARALVGPAARRGGATSRSGAWLPCAPLGSRRRDPLDRRSVGPRVFRGCEPGDGRFLGVRRADGEPAVVVPTPGALGARVTA